MARGLPFHSLHYDDLNQHREDSIRALLTHCALPATALPEALAAFDRDSQEGTVIGQGGNSQGFTEADKALLLATLAAGPTPFAPDLRL